MAKQPEFVVWKLDISYTSYTIIRMICVYELIIVDAFLLFELPFKLYAEMIIFVMSHLINDILNFNNLMHIWVQMVGTG